AFVRIAPARFTPWRLERLSDAFVRSALARSAPSRFERMSVVSVSLAFVNFALRRSLRLRSAPLKSPPLRSSPFRLSLALSHFDQLTPRSGGSSQAAFAVAAARTATSTMVAPSDPLEPMLMPTPPQRTPQRRKHIELEISMAISYLPSPEGDSPSP